MVTPRTPVRTAGRKRLSAAERRAQIVAAAREVFSESGVNGTRVREIAEHAGITEPLLYRYFHSKQEIYQLAIVDPLDEFIVALTEQTHELAQRSDIERAEVLERFHALFLGHVLEVAPLIGAALFSDPVDGPRFYDDVLFPRMRDVVSRVIADVSGWKEDSLDVDVAAQALMGVYFGIALENMLDGAQLDPAHLARQLRLLFAPGLTGGQRQRRSGRSALPPGSTTFELAIGAPPDDGRARVPRAERRELVLAAARAAFIESGPSGARSKEIADRAGITEAFLYRLFDSKEQMYLEAVQRPIERGFAELATRVRALGEQQISGREFVEALNELCLFFFVTYGGVCAIALFSELAEGRRYYREQLTPHLQEIGTVITSRLGIDDPAIDPEVARRAIVGAQWAIGFDGRLRGRESEVREIARDLGVLFTGGIRTGA